MKIPPHIQERLAQAGLEWLRIRAREYLRRSELEAQGFIAGNGHDWVTAPKTAALNWLKSGGMDSYEASALFTELYYAEQAKVEW